MKEETSLNTTRMRFPTVVNWLGDFMTTLSKTLYALGMNCLPNVSRKNVEKIIKLAIKSNLLGIECSPMNVGLEIYVTCSIILSCTTLVYIEVINQQGG